MLPPICELCDKDFRDELENNPSAGGLVSFADFESLQKGMVGHPEGMAWFCAKHYQEAMNLSSLTKPMAITQLKIKFKQN